MTGRGFRGRQVAQMMLSAAILFVGFEVFLLIAAPGCGMCPMYSEPPAFAPWLSPASGVAIGGFGLAWMIRIYRADPEGHASWWRSIRDR